MKTTYCQKAVLHRRNFELCRLNGEGAGRMGKPVINETRIGCRAFPYGFREQISKKFCGVVEIADWQRVNPNTGKVIGATAHWATHTQSNSVFSVVFWTNNQRAKNETGRKAKKKDLQYVPELLYSKSDYGVCYGSDEPTGNWSITS